MRLKNEETKELILKVARTEFLKKGFRAASLREIAKKVNGTTGIIYTYFKNKDEIFEHLVKPVLTSFETRLASEDMSLESAIEETDIDPKNWFTQNFQYLIGLIKKYPDEMNLLFLKSDGSALDNFRETLIDHGTSRNLKIFRNLKRSKEFEGKVLSEFFVRNLVIHVVNTVIEMTKQNKNNTAYFESEIIAFLYGGWKEMVKF